jgi:hypothetical protein
MSIRQFSITALVTLAVAIGTEAGLAQTSPAVPQVVRDRIAGEGRARVIVELATTSPRPVAGGRRSAEQIRERQAEIGAQRQRLRATLRAGNHRFIHEFANAPFVALEIDAHALAELESATSPAVRVFEDLLLAPALGASVPLIEADLAHELGLNGSGTVIAVIDTGVDATHAFLGPRLVAEACFASPESGSIGACPNGLSEQVGPGAAASCTFAAGTCGHGTHVAGFALGSGAEFSGVAPGAALMAIQVFHASTQCFGFESLPCARAYESDIVAALEHVYEQRSQHNIAAANLSLGGGAFASACDAQRPLLAAVIDNLKSVGIATVAASGNSGLTGAIGAPACIASAISVGATDDADEVAWFSSSSADLDLLAPGVDIESSIPGGGFAEQSGTSMAAPHVAGAWAVFKQAHPGVGVDEVLASFVITGTPIVDSRGGETKPRIRVGAAVGVELPAPLIHSISPETATAFGQDFLMTVVGAGFVGASKVHVNGIVQSTTYVDDTTLRALVRGMDLPTSGAPASVTVVTAPPGGGTSNAATLNVVLPAVHVDSTTIEAGEAVDVTIVNSTGGRDDWIALAPVGAPSTQYVLYAYARSVSPTWTVNMPETPGTYEFRLFLDDGFVQAAVSAPVTVVPLGPPTLTPSATSVAAGAPVTVTLAKGRGGSTDWVSLAAVGSAATSYVRYTYVSAGAKNWTWTVTAPETPGTYEFRLFLNNGYAQAAVSAPVTVVGSAPPPTPPEPPPTPPPTPAATLTPSATSVAAGGPVTVTLANSPGGSTDWLAFAAVGSGATSYVSYAYVGAGTKNRTWTVTAPQTPGTYEFRLFLNNGYVQAAVSVPVTVQ